MEVKGKRVLVMGLGVHGGGLGVTKWLVREGAEVTVTDLQGPDALRGSLNALQGLPIRFTLGEHREQDFLDTDLIIRNPGVPRESRWLQLAQERGIPVEMEMGLFWERLPRGGAHVIGITGTKGKTTTTMMVGAILGRVNPKTLVAGNLRISALELLDRIDADTPVVLELSSWQLEGLMPHQASPHIAGITNISPDHLNRYRDLDDYAEAKATIFRYQQPDDFLVLNFDNPILTRFAPRAISQVVWTSTRRVLNQGAYLDGDALVWRRNGTRHRILDVGKLNLVGIHNVENALAATALASVWGAQPEQIADALVHFRGVEHRQEFVREVEGVRYLNDTTATAPAAAVAAIQAFAPGARRIILIAGGADKGLEFAEMARMIVARVQHLILLEGTATDKLADEVARAGGSGVLVGRFNDLQRAVEHARDLAREGDVVLLSPGAASFGMFANEFERGAQFKRIVDSM